MKNLILTLLVFASFLNLNAQDKTIVEIAAGNENFETLVAAVTAADLVETLNSDGEFTVFAPTDDAFAALPAGLVEALVKPENKATLQKILTYHVVGAALPASAVVDGIKSNNGKLKATTVEGGQFSVMLDGGNVVIEDAQGNKSKVITTDIMASNGIIHVIDAVILPAGVDPAALLPKKWSSADNMKTETKTHSATNRASQVQESIVEVAIGADNLTTLVAAVKAADLVDVLNGDDEYTVFAPTDEAFGELPEGTVATLVKPENKATLQNILKYHVVKGTVDAKTIMRRINREGGYFTFKTLTGQHLVASRAGGKVKISDGNGNNFYVVAADVEASNGVVHLIDGVMLPSNRYEGK